MKLAKILKACRIDKPARFRLADYDPAERFGLSTDVDDVKPMLADGVARLQELQQRLYAQGQWGVLVVFQGMDAAGKDSVVKHVMTGINPQGCEVHAFKAPSSEELEHDFLWRTDKDVPARGRIGIFNRSHYEEVLVVRVHPELLKKQNLPASADGKNLAASFQGNPRLRKAADAQRHAGAEISSAPFQGGTAQAFPGAARRAVQALEVLHERHRGTGPLERIHDRLRGPDTGNLDRFCALVRGPGGPQAHHLDGRIRGDHRRRWNS